MEKLIIDNKDDVKKKVNDSYLEAMNNPDFANLTKKAKVDEEQIKKNTSKFLDTLVELNNCKNCKGLFMCKNAVNGNVYFPKNVEGSLRFYYMPCKYMKKEQEAINNKMTSAKVLAMARMKDVDVTDKQRVPLIKWLKKFYDEFDKYKATSGLYLHGSFGSGKTFLISAIFNELREKKNIDSEIVYFPELLRSIKEDFSKMDDIIDRLQTVDLLLIDDIGAESVTEWGRDEILGTILQYRMNNAMTTFFTSNLTIDELESHLAISKNNEDKVKARRIIERIKQLTEDMELVSINRRN